jgi:hypothetical protein
MKPRKKKAPFTRRQKQPTPPVTSRELVVLDQSLARQTLLAKYTSQLAALHTANAHWQRFLNEDRLRFQTWRSQNFAPILTKIATLKTQILEQEDLVRQVDDEVHFGRARNYRVAYANVLQRLATPDSPPEEPPPLPDLREFPHLPESEQKRLFESMAAQSLGAHPKNLPKHLYDKLFANFKRSLLKQAPKKSPPSPATNPTPDSSPPTTSRLKEIYRILVRKLHPDTGAKLETPSLWHEVQDAYNAQDLPRLEILLTKSNLQTNPISELSTLAELKALLRDLRRSFNLVQSDLREAQRSPAWNFSQCSDLPALTKKFRSQLDRSLLDHEDQLSEVLILISCWGPPPKSSPKKTRKSAPR